MSLRRLENIVTPPDVPSEIPNEIIWIAVEKKLTKLPDDYRAFIQRYGTGCIDSFIWIFSPASENLNLNLEQQARKQEETIKAINESGVEPFIPLFPHSLGVLPFGITDNGDVLFWVNKGKPNSWTVAVLEARRSPMLEFDMNMTCFLAELCEGSITCEAFPDDFPSSAPVFTAGNKRD